MHIKKKIMVTLDFEIKDLDNVTFGDVSKQVDVICQNIKDHFSINSINGILTRDKIVVTVDDVKPNN